MSTLSDSTRGSKQHHPSLVGKVEKGEELWHEFLQKLVEEFNTLEPETYTAIIDCQLGLATNQGIPPHSVTQVIRLLDGLSSQARESLESYSIIESTHKTILEEMSNYVEIKDFLESHQVSI
jgi:hypothetical protein